MIKPLALLAALLPSFAFAGSMRITLIPDSTDPAPVGATKYSLFSGCMESGQYERPVEKSDVPTFTIEVPDTGRCWFAAQWQDSKGELSVISNEIVLDFDANRPVSSAPTAGSTR